MPSPLDKLVSDTVTAGRLIAMLELARWAALNPEFRAGRWLTPPVFWRCMTNARGVIWDAADDGCDVNASAQLADAMAESLGLIGVAERMGAIDFHRRSGASETERILVVSRQLTRAIARLKSALANAVAHSN
jgi:hypothetical protein